MLPEQSHELLRNDVFFARLQHEGIHSQTGAIFSSPERNRGRPIAQDL
jgi:hypothetical protein